MKVKAGSTNVSVYYYIVQDASATSPGEPVTGLLFSDIETGGSASYVRQGAARTDLTLITLASASAGHDDGGFILVDDTNAPGLYRCDYPDAAFATGIDQVFLQIVVASGKNAIAAPILVDIDDNVDQTADHTAGIANIPTVSEFNARTLVAASYFDPAADAVANVTLCATTTALTNVINAASIVASVSGNVDGSVGSVTGDTKQTADHTAAIADIPTVAEFNARTLVAASYFDPAADAVANVTLVATTTALTNVINAASIVASVSGNVDGSVDSVTGDTKQTADHTANIAAILVDTGTTIPATLGTPAGADMSADIAAVKVDTAATLVDTSTTLPALIDDLAIKKNATFSNFEFLMVLTSDHVTPATGLTVTGQRSIDGGAFASVGGTIAEVSNGIYQFDALAADTNGDVITWRFSSGTADDTFVTFKTVA